MSFVVYFFVLMVAAASVLFGLDLLEAPMSPMPASKYELRAANTPDKAPNPAPNLAPESPRSAVAVTKPVAIPVARPVVQPVAAPPAQVAAQITQVEAAEGIIAPGAPVPVQPASPRARAPKCDLDACAAAYRSFSAADCTYQPSDGPRRLCTKGTPPRTFGQSALPTAPAVSSPAERAQARAQATCNIAACSQAYVSFTATDCTYQPLDGPRRICTK